MPIYHSLGDLPRKRHTAFRKPDGGVFHEELVGNKGFTGPSSLLYHLRPPTRVRSVEQLRDIRPVALADAPLRMRHFRTGALGEGGDLTLERVPLLFNDDVILSFAVGGAGEGPLYRNGEADELIYVDQGSGVLESALGEIPFGEGDQLVVPRGITTRLRSLGPARLLIVETRGELRWPKHYLTDRGQLREGAPFSERDIRRPSSLSPIDDDGDHEIIVKKGGALHRVVLGHHPFDVVGWDGFYYPWAFQIMDFEPITGAIHQPPPVHQLLGAQGVVICNFVPRPFDFHPQSVPAPYHHANVMTDEVLFYASQEFMSRKGIEHGSITLHPDGLPHGPHPGRYEGSIGVERTDELAVMVDTFRPLQVASGAAAIEDADYLRSWL